ncbi:MAG: hypothetical protein K0M45_07245 [Candidatus Paracaedibacteraceae bacterium]|nr:hypothetical protein [Candidatus Paracaedibacteraceae bacterium]
MNKTITVLLIAYTIIIPFTKICASEYNNVEQSRGNNGLSQIFISEGEYAKFQPSASLEWLTKVIAERDGREVLKYLTDLKIKRNQES